MNPNLQNFYPNNTPIDVHAFAIDCQQIYYNCPFCLKIHTHGNPNKSLLNRIETRGSHCELPIKSNDVNINITHYTRRCCIFTDDDGELKELNGDILKRIFQKQVEKTWCIENGLLNIPN